MQAPRKPTGSGTAFLSKTRVRTSHLLLALALVPAFAASADPPKIPKAQQAPEVRLQGEQVTLPIVMVREFPFIEGQVEGVKGKLMLDTGMEQAMAINDHRVPLRGGQSVGTGFFGSGQRFDIRLMPQVQDVRVGPLAFDRVTHVQAQDARLLEGITPDFIGWIGHHAWSGHALKLDYRRLQATFYKGGPARYLAGEKVIAVLPFGLRKLPNHPIVKAKIGGIDAVGAFDTGQYGALFTSDATRDHLVSKGHLRQSPDDKDTFDLASLVLAGSRVAPVKGLEVQTTPFAAAAPLGLTEHDVLVLGYGFLQHYKTVWDYQRRRIYLLAP